MKKIILLFSVLALLASCKKENTDTSKCGVITAFDSLYVGSEVDTVYIGAVITYPNGVTVAPILISEQHDKKYKINSSWCETENKVVSLKK
jgi:hypothetical protein